MSGGVSSVGGLLPRDLLDRVVGGDSLGAGDGADRLRAGARRASQRRHHPVVEPVAGGVGGVPPALEARLPESDQTATALTRERWLRPLFDELGFAGLAGGRGVAVDGKDYPISHMWAETIPIHLPGARVPIDRIDAGRAGCRPHVAARTGAGVPQPVRGEPVGDRLATACCCGSCATTPR